MGYQAKIEKEIEVFKDNFNVHDLPEAHNYIMCKYVVKKLKETFGFSSYDEMIINCLNLIKSQKDESDIKILSLGSGNCDLEVNLALKNNIKAKFYLYEINSHMLDRGQLLVHEKLGAGNNFEFVQCDINKLELHQQFDIILACHSLHHLVELEHIFNEIHRNMTDKSYFIVNDMIGRNGHMFWDNTFSIVNSLWRTLPKELKYSNSLKSHFKNRIQWDWSVEGFEGIRAQDILPILDKTFNFKDFAPFWSISNRFIDREYGHNYDLNNDFHKELLDMIFTYDDYFLTNKMLKPTQMFATLVKKDVEVFDYKYLYFENPRDAYVQDETRIWDHFDNYTNETKEVLKAKTGSRPIFIWGAGIFGIQILFLLRDLGFNIQGFIDSNPMKHADTVEEMPVYAPVALNGGYESKPFIVIGTIPKHHKEIEAQLKKLGFDIENDCWSYL